MDRDALAASGVLDAPYVAVRCDGGVSRIAGVCHRRWGESEEVAGFGEWSWDGATLRARTDPWGFTSIFYWVHRDGIAVSSSLVRLLALGAPRELDDEAMAVFLRLGAFVGEDTPFRAIRALPPNGRLEWSTVGLHVCGGPRIVPVVPMSRDDAMDAYIAAFRDAVRRALPARDGCVVPLSGGCDSRHILFELHAQDALPDACITLLNYPPRGQHDPSVAAAVARAVGVRHEMVPEHPSRVHAELRKNFETHFCADEHAWFTALPDAIGGRWGTLFDGIAGDVLSSGFRVLPGPMALLERRAWRELARLYLADEGALRVMRPEAARRFPLEAAVERIAPLIESHEKAGNPLSSFFFWNRTRREIALVPFGLLSRVGRVVAPFLDRGVFELLAALPAETFRGGAFHIDAVRRAYPRFAHLPFEKEVHPVARVMPRPEWPAFFRRTLREASRYVLGGPRSELVRRGWLVRRAAWWTLRGDFTDPDIAMRAVYLLQLEGLARLFA